MNFSIPKFDKNKISQMNFSIPKFDKDIPIISSASGTDVAYKDPNSPESLMKKVATLEAQAIVDSMYDAKIETHSEKKIKESFMNFRLFQKKQRLRKNNTQSLLLLFFVFLLFLSLVTMKSLRKNAKIYLLFLVIALFTYSIILYQK
jgi:hypothetical protein